MPDEPLNLGLLLFIPYRAMEAAVLDELRAHGHELTVGQARVFQRLGPGGSRPGELAEATAAEQADSGLDPGPAGAGAGTSSGRSTRPTDGPAWSRSRRRDRSSSELSLPVVREIERSWAEHLGPARTRQLREALVELRRDHRPVPGVTRLMQRSRPDHLDRSKNASHHGHMTTLRATRPPPRRLHPRGVQPSARPPTALTHPPSS